VLHEADQVRVVHHIEEAGDVGIQDPAHRRALDRHRQGIQRIVLAASRPETVAEAAEVLLVAGVQRFDRRPLDDLVLQRRDAERPLPPVRLGYVVTARWLRPVAAALDAGVQVLKPGFQTGAAVPPRQSVHSRRRFPLKLVIGPAQQIDVDVVEQGGEPFRSPVLCCLPYALQSGGHAGPALCPGHVDLARVPLGPGPSLRRLHPRRRGSVRRLLRSYGRVRLLSPDRRSCDPRSGGRSPGSRARSIRLPARSRSGFASAKAGAWQGL
jgi:hypothetical protein